MGQPILPVDPSTPFRTAVKGNQRHITHFGGCATLRHTHVVLKPSGYGSRFQAARNWTAGFSQCFHSPGQPMFGVPISDAHLKWRRSSHPCAWLNKKTMSSSMHTTKPNTTRKWLHQESQTMKKRNKHAWLNQPPQTMKKRKRKNSRGTAKGSSYHTAFGGVWRCTAEQRPRADADHPIQPEGRLPSPAGQSDAAVQLENSVALSELSRNQNLVLKWS